MTFRFFRSALSALCLSALPLAAQTATPPPAATPAPEDEKKPKLGYFRFWNMMPTEAGEFQLLHDAGGPEPVILIGAESMNFFADYVGVKPGRYALKVVRVADPKTVLKTFDVVMKKDVFVTFYARAIEGKLSLEMLDDTYDLEKALTGKIVLRQFVKDAAITVKSTALSQPAALAFGEERVLENLPLKPVVFQMQATMPDGKVRSWASEVDFRNTRHASLFLVLDVYGRFRPRPSADGQAEVDYSKK